MSKRIGIVTAGDPSLEKTREFLEILTRQCDYAGVGFPFSDPIAEDEITEAANMRSLNGGVTTDKIFACLQAAGLSRLIALTYINPLFVYGCDRFFSECQKSGVCGVLVPDLPYEERGEVLPFAQKYGIDLIIQIAPNSAGRIEMLAKAATGLVVITPSCARDGKSQNELSVAEIAARIRRVTRVPIYAAAAAVCSQADQEAVDGIVLSTELANLIAANADEAVQNLNILLNAN